MKVCDDPNSDEVDTVCCRDPNYQVLHIVCIQEKPVLLFILFRVRDQIMIMITMMMMMLFWMKKNLIKYEKMKTGKYRMII